MNGFGKCPKCNGAMEPIACPDIRNSHGRWINAEFTICTECAFPVLRFVGSSRWSIVIGSQGVAVETEVP